MRDRGSAVFTGLVAVAAAFALAQTAGWPIKTSLYPRAVGLPLLVLAVVETVLCLRRGEDTGAGEAVDVTLSDAVPPDEASRRTLSTVAWIGGFFAAIILIGFPRAVPLFVFGYVRGQGKEGWVLSIALAALSWLAFDLLFVRLLHTPFGDGILWRF